MTEMETCIAALKAVGFPYFNYYWEDPTAEELLGAYLAVALPGLDGNYHYELTLYFDCSGKFHHCDRQMAQD